MGRFRDPYSKKIISVLKKKFRFLDIYFSKNKDHKPTQKILNWQGDIIICFRSHYILDTKLIKKAKICAINFHPGPPQYRGIGCVNFALNNLEKYYGATAHLIEKKVDFGKILDCKFFKIKNKDTIDEVLKKTYKIQIRQFNFLINKLIKNNYDLKSFKKNYQWSSKLYLRKDLEKLYRISPNIKKKELVKKIRATNTYKFKPYVIVQGCKFILDI